MNNPDSENKFDNGNKNKIISEKSKIIGNKGEDLACFFLENKGYEIITRNYRREKCEIDIICKKDNYIIFTEIKTRTSVKYGRAAESVTKRKQMNIIKAAEYFIFEFAEYEIFQPRFDVIEIHMDIINNRNYINLIESAFTC